jgi:subtilisin family serine protease
MKKVIPLLTAMMLLLSATAAVSAPSPGPGEVLVKYRAGNYPRHLQGSLAKIGWAKIKIGNNETMHSVMAALTRQSDIEHVEPNTHGEFLADPDDPRFPEQRYLPAIKAPEAWDTSLGTGVIIGLVDSGVDLDHEDLADHILPNGWDFGDDDADPDDELGHGTQVCGIIAAEQNNGLGISGVAPQSKILPLKISQGNTDIFTDATVAEAIIYAADNGAAIINLSLGWNDEQDHAAVTDAIAYAADKGLTLVAAAGNRYGPVWFPAKLEKVVAVSAIDKYNQNVYSAYGPELDLVAPGSGNTLDDFILTTASGGGYTFNKGTSFSAAMVSAAAALLLSEQPHLTNSQVATVLANRADDLGEPGPDDMFGAGRVNALATLDSLISFVFPSRIAGSKTMPFAYLLALLGYDTRFLPLFSRVSFSSEYLRPLGPPVVALPRLLLQLVILKPDAPEGFSDITVTTGNEEAEGYDAVYISRPRMNVPAEENRLQTN